MRDGVGNACFEKSTQPETLRGTVNLCLAIMILRKKPRISRILLLLQISPFPKYCVLQRFLTSPATGQPE